MSPCHPDPGGEQLKQLRSLVALNGKVVFWDFVCLFQILRTSEQDRLFREALSQMHLLYAHCQAMVVRLTDTMASALTKTPYSNRGWPTFETAASSGAAKVVTIFNNRAGNSQMDRPVPMSKHTFAETLDTKVFTSRRADLQAVKKLYENVYDLVSTKRTLNVGDWNDAQAYELVKVIGELPRLRIMEVRLAQAPVCWQPEISAAAAKAGVAEIWPIHEALLCGAVLSMELALHVPSTATQLFEELLGPGLPKWVIRLLLFLFAPTLFGPGLLADRARNSKERRLRAKAAGEAPQRDGLCVILTLLWLLRAANLPVAVVLISYVCARSRAHFRQQLVRFVVFLAFTLLTAYNGLSWIRCRCRSARQCRFSRSESS